MKINAVISSHRSIRKYRKDSLTEALLSGILQAGIRASNTGNMQMYSFVVTTDLSIREKLFHAHFKQNMVLEAPVHITFCADIQRFSLWCKQRKANPGYDNFLWFCTAMTDAVLASENIALAAEEAGLGICYLGTVLYNADQFIETLDLPWGVVPVTALVLGYPDESPPLTERLPKEAVIHHEKYQMPTLEDIDSFYHELEQSERTSELLAINAKKTLAQVFTENRYPKDANQLFSQKYLKVLEKQGFLSPAQRD